MDFFTSVSNWLSRKGIPLKSGRRRGRNAGASYRAKLSRHGHGRLAVWLLSLAVLLTTVTIASIPSREATSLQPAEGLAITHPKQILKITGLSGNPMEYLPAQGTVSAIEPRPDTPLPATGQPDTDGWIHVTVRRGDTLTGILDKQGVSADDISALIMTQSQTKTLSRLRPGHKIKMRITDTGKLRELEYKMNIAEYLRIKREGDKFSLVKESREFESRLAYVSGIIETSLFDAGQEAGLADALIMRLVDIFGWDIDFALDLRPGDSFSVVHEENYWLGQKVGDGRILAAEFVNKGKPYRAIAHRGKTGFTSYYTPEGLSMHKEFLRTPVEFSRISSRFSRGRYHPILKKWRRHTGVDYAAPTGTSARATAAGRILSIRRRGGYGKTVVIKHGGNYSTLYAHLSRYGRSIRVGSYVEQGQIIGYVGSTGLATGPHLHYEFRVNDVHRNPLTFKFPRAQSIKAEYMQEFLQNAKAWTAKLDLMGRQNLIASSE